jgi:hypothetical protein
MGIYSLYDCVKAGYIDVRLSIWYKGESDLGYEMVYIHAEELDWPYRLSHVITTHHYGEDNMLVLVSFLLAHSSGPLLALQVS